MVAKGTDFNRYRLEQAEPEEIAWVAQVERDLYSLQDAIPEHILKGWYAKNPNGFSILKTRNSQKIGHIDILPLRPVVLQKFISDEIAERDIRGDDIYSLSEKNLIRDLYIESLAVVLPNSYSRAPATLFLICNLTSAIGRICDVSKVENIYAIAATIEGNRFLSTLGFRVHREAQYRKDHHNLFVINFRELIVLTSRICKRRYERHQKLGIG